MSCSTFKHLVLESEAFINTVGRQWHSVTHPADNPSWEDRGYLQTMVFPRVVAVRHHSEQRLVSTTFYPASLSHTHSPPQPLGSQSFSFQRNITCGLEARTRFTFSSFSGQSNHVKHCFATWLETLHSCAPPSPTSSNPTCDSYIAFA